ncbi:hypothetical protein QN382_14750 [Pseudomonas sp. 10B1]|uniref:hypothetical protein n=1 Tax=unclassified Pseudomonas TaxID=196821 RepID=UPI002AB33A77|nr:MULTISPECIES: hypothetical protein [unclassified Pseudomonas]MDY7561533.1 hypothetical protein [Pseudomonas sp. AB6]MEA9979164.1 hypothetical protein [Pseudomonas sp. RTS4]MEA9994973.1 hypothetical protein [Pseudomonas sp. AA4]MEB0088207.1 hypothetical protein [Pseudomonas sp. RTI1]MEB0127081.1 hypothetical protein [Pseudomonas sp. CCC1.2]
MTKWMMFGALLFLGGCTHRCDNTTNFNSNSDDSLSASPCRAQYLLYQNDMIQAKLLVSARGNENTELAKALLQRAAHQDQSGEAEFYQAVLLIRAEHNPSESNDLLEQAARRKHPLAIALLAQRLTLTDPKQAERLRAEYAELDVATSGYPSFEQAQFVANGLIAKTARSMP